MTFDERIKATIETLHASTLDQFSHMGIKLSEREIALVSIGKLGSLGYEGVIPVDGVIATRQSLIEIVKRCTPDGLADAVAE